jgi:predicted dehydrogenase
MSAPIRIGFIGSGSFARHHAQQLLQQENVQIVACCDIHDETCRSFARDFKVQATYSDYRQMLEKERLDAVTIPASDAVHCPASLAALERGLHVMCEKPMAVSLAEAEQMAAAARKAGTINMVQFSYRSTAALEQARQMVADGHLGRVLHVEASYLQSWLVSKVWGDWRSTSAWLWRLSREHHGGTLVDIGCHIFDFASYVVGDVVEVNCMMRNFEKAPGNIHGQWRLDADDSFVAQVAFANGAIGSVHSSRWATGHLNSLRLRVFGDKGGLCIDTDRGGDKISICVGDFHAHGAHWTEIPVKMPVPGNFARFVRSIRTGVAEGATFEDGLKIQRVLDACARSSAEGRAIRLAEAKPEMSAASI